MSRESLLDEAIAKAKEAEDWQLVEWLRMARGGESAARWYTAKLSEARLDMSNLMAENAELREQLEYDRQTARSRLERIDQLKADNAELRKSLEFANNEWEKNSIEFLNLQAENATLRQQLADVTESVGRLEERCAKLRELVWDMVDYGEGAGNSIVWFFSDRMHELGIEVGQ